MITSWLSIWRLSTFRDIFHPSLGNVNDYVAHTYRKYLNLDGNKQVLRKNGYQESIISKICKRITNNHSLSQLKQTEATDIKEDAIRMTINLPYVKGTNEKNMAHRSHKIRSTFYNKNIFHILLCKSKDWVAIENKNNRFWNWL